MPGVDPLVETRIPVRGEIDIATAPDLLMALDEAIDADPGGTVVVDLSRVGFIDSTGLGVLVAAQRRARAHGGSLNAVDPGPPVRRVLQITGLDKLLLEPQPCGSTRR